MKLQGYANYLSQFDNKKFLISIMNDQNNNNDPQDDGDIHNPPAVPQERPVSPSSASGNGEEETANADDNQAKRTKTQEQPDHVATNHNRPADPQDLNHQQQHPCNNAMYPSHNSHHPLMPINPQHGMMYPMMLPPYFSNPPFDHNPPPPAVFPPNPLLTNLLPLASPSDQQLDATRIFYENQMREHAAQYANAAAGAAWAAARIAYGDHPHEMMNHPASSSLYCDSGEAVGNNNHEFHSNSKRRTLWKPPNKNDKRDSKHESSSDRSYEKEKSSKQSLDTKRSKKRESNNDSVSSLGSGSRDRSHPNHKQPRCNHSKNRNQQRQNKRGLYQSHSPRGSSSSLGTMGSHPSNTYRQKRRNTESRGTTGSGVSVFLGGLIGKSGTCALHELCSKYRWEMPMYELIEPCEGSLKGSADEEGGGSNVKNYSGNSRDFILSVRVNGVELGRGRGGTKGSSKQDASRKALAALIPG